MFSAQIFSLDAFSWVTWRCTRVGPGAIPTPASTCHNPCIVRPVLRDDTWHRLSLLVVGFTALSCRMFQSCFIAFRAKARVDAFRLRPAGAIPAKAGGCNTGVGLRQPDMVRRELLIATSTFFKCELLLQTGAQR